MKTYQCPYCDKKLIRDKLVSHIEKYHDEEVPDNYTPYRLVYDIVNDKQGTVLYVGNLLNGMKNDRNMKGFVETQSAMKL